MIPKKEKRKRLTLRCNNGNLTAMKDLKFKTKSEYVDTLVSLMNEMSNAISDYRNKRMTQKQFDEFVKNNEQQAIAARNYAVEKGIVNDADVGDRA